MKHHLRFVYHKLIPLILARARSVKKLVQRIMAGDAAAVWHHHPLALVSGEEGERHIHQPERAKGIPSGGEVVAIAEALNQLNRQDQTRGQGDGSNQRMLTTLKRLFS